MDESLEDVVISGISGRFPESENIEELKRNLLEGIDMVTDNEARFSPQSYGLPRRSGVLKDVESFDASFFNIPPKQANKVDPQIRLLLEVTYEAIIDAGVNPVELSDTKTGVYIGAWSSDAEDFWLQDESVSDGFGILGGSRSMLANKISHYFNFNGPSYQLDSACSSSLYALVQAMNDIRAGRCNAAIVGTTNLFFRPAKTVQLAKLNMLSEDGCCKSFDKSANGYVRSEIAMTLLLQKARDARRNYATIVHGKTNTDGYKSQGITHPRSEKQRQLLEEIYREAKINPLDVVYFEAHGTGTQVGDPEEIRAIADVFCKGRKEPLLIGSVKSNIGHTEPASGLCSVAKVIIAMESGIIPANLHYREANPSIQPIVDGRIQVVDRNTTLKGSLVSVSSFGVGGANAHVLLRRNELSKNLMSIKRTLPLLVAVSGRTNEAVESFLDNVREHYDDNGYVSLIQNIHANNIPGHFVRAYEMYGDSPVRDIANSVTTDRPIWYIFSGMGTQWAGMGKQLLAMECFKNSIEKCAQVLKAFDIDLIDLLTNYGNNTFESVVNSSVSIASIQIALVDVLTLLKIYPDGLIGHSVGEFGCAYADGTITLEQAVLIAYVRAKCISETHRTRGAMAAIGLGWEETQKLCPPEITLACDNAPDSVTVSGPLESIERFVMQMQTRKVFVKMIDSFEVAFHSKHVQEAGKLFLQKLEEIISCPMERSTKWISSSVPKSRWDEPSAKFSSPEYHANNLLSPVLFYQALQHIPENAIVIEIAPHSLLQAILRRNLPPGITILGLQNSRHSNNLHLLLNNIGNLYNAGAHPQIHRLYQFVEHPVSRGTPMISPLVKWDHSVKWAVPDFSLNSTFGQRNVVKVDLTTDDYKQIAGNVIDEKILFPASGYIILAWKFFAKQMNEYFENVPIVIENFELLRDTVLQENSSACFTVNITYESGKFEIFEKELLTARGTIVKMIENNESAKSEIAGSFDVDKNKAGLLKSDIYRELKLRGYNYQNLFQRLIATDSERKSGLIVNTDDWISFIDSLIQFKLLGIDTKHLLLTKKISHISINPTKHKEILSTKQPLTVKKYTETEILKCSGVEIRGIELKITQRRQVHSPPIYEKYLFVPFESNQEMSEIPAIAQRHALTVLLQIVAENLQSSTITTLELTEEREEKYLLTPFALEILHKGNSTKIESRLVSGSEKAYENLMEQYRLQVVNHNFQDSRINSDAHIVFAAYVISTNDTRVLQNIVYSVKPGGFFILEEVKSIDLTAIKDPNLIYCGKQAVKNNVYVLFKKRKVLRESLIIQITEKNFDWLQEVKEALKKSEEDQQAILLVNQGEKNSGLVGLANCLRLEPGGSNLQYIFTQDENVPYFSVEETFYSSQLGKQLVANVYKNGHWGTFCHLLLDEQNDGFRVSTTEAYVDNPIKGDLSSLRWIASSIKLHLFTPSSDQEIHSTYYVGVNFEDVMLADGKLSLGVNAGIKSSEDYYLGFEYAGRDSESHRVMGISRGRGLATSVVPDAVFQWEAPDKWTLAQAATIPVAYASSYYALFYKVKICKGQSILIHCGCEGLGLASISIALHAGCKVFATVASQEKRSLLKKMFPQLPDRNIGNSRDTSFEQMVMTETEGRGVDFVLNSLEKDKLDASIRCLALDGQFLETGKFDLSENCQLEMSFLLKNASFHGIFFDSLMTATANKKHEIRNLINEGIKNGAVQPLPMTVFTEQQVENAFRFLASEKHIGKVLVKIRDEEFESLVNPPEKIIPAVPRTYFYYNKSYIVIGGVGGFGLELVEWMISRGANNFVLSSRSGVKTGYQSFCLRKWRERGVTIKTTTLDASTMEGAKQLITEALNLSPVGGIFNLAAILHDAFFENLDEDHFKEVCSAKVDVTKNLDSLARTYGSELDHFVGFSSVASGRGNPGQSNYGMANSAMERIIEERHESGLPGLAIQWGFIKDVGLAEGPNKIINEGSHGVTFQSVSSCLDSLDLFLRLPYPVLTSSVLENKEDFIQNIKDLSAEQAVANILGIRNITTLNSDISLNDFGMDSYTILEVRQTLKNNYNLLLTIADIRKLTFFDLRELSKK